VKFAAIAGWADSDEYPVTFMCRELCVSTSGYYDWRNGRPSARAETDAELIAIMRKLHAAARGNPGVRRMRAELAAVGRRVGLKRVWRLMRAAGLRGRHPKAWKRTTIGADRPVSAPDLIGRQFSAAEPDQRWCGDVTYIKTWDGWAYLATVIDLHSRRVVGWAIADHMRTSLVTDALDMALALRTPPAGVIFHSDRGAQGRFNRSSQHLVITEVFDGATSAAGGSGFAAGDALTGPADAGQACGARVLAPDRAGKAHGGRRARSRRVHAGRVALVSPRWRHAAVEPGRAHRPLPVIPRA
jgi:hypothetical protein